MKDWEADRGSVVENVSTRVSVSVGSSLKVVERDWAIETENDADSLTVFASVTENVAVSENVVVPDGVIES